MRSLATVTAVIVATVVVAAIVVGRLLVGGLLVRRLLIGAGAVRGADLAANEAANRGAGLPHSWPIPAPTAAPMAALRAVVVPDWLGGVSVLHAASPPMMAASSEVLIRVFFMWCLLCLPGFGMAKE